MQGVPGEGHVQTVRVKVHWSTATGFQLSSDLNDGIQSPEAGATVPASSAAVAGYLGEFRPPAVTVEEPVHREFDMTVQDSDTESVGTIQPADHERNSNRRLQLEFPTRSTGKSGLRQKWWTIWVAESGQCLWKVASRDWQGNRDGRLSMCRCFGTRPVWHRVLLCWSGSWHPHLAFPDPSFAKSCDRGALFPEKV